MSGDVSFLDGPIALVGWTWARIVAVMHLPMGVAAGPLPHEPLQPIVIGLDPQPGAAYFGARLHENVLLSDDGLAPGFDYLIQVRGLNGVLDDVRAVEVLTSFLGYKSVSGVILGVLGTEDRVALSDGEPGFTRVEGQPFQSEVGLWLSELRQLEEAGLPLRAALTPLTSTRSTSVNG